MKSIVVVLAGAADHPTEELGGKTPLEVAKVPHLNFFAKSGKVGIAKLVSDRLPPSAWLLVRLSTRLRLLTLCR